MSMEAPPRNVVESPLLTMTRTTPTRLWNDSADPGELTAAISWGAVGATANPVIALAALRADAPRWRERLTTLAAEHPTATESELGWLAVEELSVAAAALLEPAFRASGGRDGRLSIQTDPRLWRDAERLVEQAVHFDAPRAERRRQDPGHLGGDRGDRGGHGPGDQHQRHRLVHGRRRRSPSARPSSAACAGVRRQVTT